MKTDNYTKIVLTFIAVCLLILTLDKVDLIPKAFASAPVDLHEYTSANYGLLPLNEDGSVSVKLSGPEEVDINIVGINTSDELDINIDEIGGGYLSSGGPIRIKSE